MQPDFSIIIPARNEEKHLPHCLAALQASLKQASRNAEIIVVINRCTDRTLEIARNNGCKVVENDAKNLAIIRNAGAKKATGRYLITVDADSVVSENMISEIDKALSKENIVGGGVLILPSRWSLGIFLTALLLLPIALKDRISGGLFFCRKEDFDAIGGFNEELVSVEDIDFAKRLKQHGKKTKRKFTTLFRASIRTSMRKFDTFGDWYFLTRPRTFLKLLGGKDRKLSDQVWYDYEEEKKKD